MTPYSLKGLPVMIQVSFSSNNQDWEPIRTWQLCSPRASIHSVLHVREPQTRLDVGSQSRALEPTLRCSGFETETSRTEVKVRGQIFYRSGLHGLIGVVHAVSVIRRVWNEASKMVHNFSCVSFKVFFASFRGTQIQNVVKRLSRAGSLSVRRWKRSVPWWCRSLLMFSLFLKRLPRFLSL